MKLLKLVPDDTNINFLKWRTWAFGISLLLMLASVGLVATKGLNFGVDFIGGQKRRLGSCVKRSLIWVMAIRQSSGLARKTRFRSG
jgi:preprotein translocase subunit SecF